ncbi:MAG: hypothetical protein GJ680_16545 [Alteromonadaceae bacterium]|nr:hypothetical protein [Alteromonadaceae bacterium]
MINKSITHKVILAALTLLLAACSSPPSTIKYYQLDSAKHSLKPTAKLSFSAQSQHVVVQQLELPDYLKHSMLVVRTSPHQVYFSRENVWAEKPSKAILNQLIADLNATSEQVWYSSWRTPIERENSHGLQVHITHFYPTENSEVILSGNIVFIAADPELSWQQEFAFSQPLRRDGYEHAMEVMRAQIKQLAEMINSAVTK